MCKCLYNFVFAIILLGLIVAVGQISITEAQVIKYPVNYVKYLRYENSGGEIALTTYDYDENGRPKTTVWEQFDKFRSSLNRLYYDDKGNIIKKYREFSDSVIIEERFEYDDSGRWIKELYSRSDGKEGVTVFEYDETGKMSKAVCKNYKGWFNGELIYKWENDRRVAADIIYEGENAGDISYEYDDEGRMIKEHWNVQDQWTQTFKYEYYPVIKNDTRSYTSANVFIRPKDKYAVALEDYDYSGESGGPSYYAYQSGGKLTDKRFVRSDGLMTNTAFIYDEDRQLLNSYRIYADGRHGIFSYKFNDDRELIERTLRLSDGGSGSEKYEYDADGNLLSADYKNFDSWLSGAISFEYSDDLLSKGTFKGETGFNADISFDHDELNHLSKIDWQFSYGGSQTYTFKYAKYDDLPTSLPYISKPSLLTAVDLPATESGKRMARIIELINSGEEAEIKDYLSNNMTDDLLKKYSVEMQTEYFLDMRKKYPDIFPVYIKTDEPDKIVIKTQSRKKLGYLALLVQVEPEPPYTISSIAMVPTSPPPGADPITDPDLLDKLEKLANLPDGESTEVVFVCPVGNAAQLDRAYGLAQSIRKFGGTYKQAPIWVIGPAELTTENSAAIRKFAGLDVALKSCVVPDEASWYYLSNNVFAAAEAEKQAAGKAKIIVILGSDTIMLDEPSEFILSDGVKLGYRPVMHKNISPLYSEPLDSYWSRAYDVMKVDQANVFPMVTPGDNDSIRPYFNASCLSVRPELGLMERWANTYLKLCGDSVIKAEAVADPRKRVFTFQVALTGTFLNNLKRNEMAEISGRYNYPIFFKEQFGSKNDFHDITNIVTIRYENFFDKPIAGWEEILKGPKDRIDWMKANLVETN